VSLSGVHEKFLDVGECLMFLDLLLHRQYVLGVVTRINHVLVTTRDGEERPRMGDDDERQAVVKYVEQVVVLNLFQAHTQRQTL